MVMALLGCLLLGSASCRSTDAPAANAREFKDELGRAIKVAAQPERIISLAPSVTEMLYALGLDGKLVAVTSYCDYPPEAKQKEKVGDTMRPGIERIVALKPDLVIASTASQLEQFVRKLDEVGIPVYVSNPRNVEEAMLSIERVGAVAGAASQAVALTEKLRARMEAVRLRVEGRPRPRVLLILGTQPLIVPGGGSFVNDLINRAGGQSISSDNAADYPQFSLEAAIARQPEVIFLQAGESLLPDRLKQTPAAARGRVYTIDDSLMLRPGPRIVEGLEQMAARIHPE